MSAVDNVDIDHLLADLQNLSPSTGPSSSSGSAFKYQPHPPRDHKSPAQVNPKSKFVVVRDHQSPPQQTTSASQPIAGSSEHLSLDQWLESVDTLLGSPQPIPQTNAVHGGNINNNSSSMYRSSDVPTPVSPSFTRTVVGAPTFGAGAPLSSTSAASPGVNADDVWDNSWDEEPSGLRAVPIRSGSGYPSSNANRSSAVAAPGATTATKVRCAKVFLGSSQSARGLRSAGSDAVCDKLLCSACNFSVLQLTQRRWTPAVDYLFVRTHMPNEAQLRQRTVAESGCVAYCCQCSWISVAESDASSDGADPQTFCVGPKALTLGRSGEPQWLCAGHPPR